MSSISNSGAPPEREDRPIEDEAASDAFGGATHKNTSTAADAHAGSSPVGTAPLAVLAPTRNAILAKVTESFLSSHARFSTQSGLAIESALLVLTNNAFRAENRRRVGIVGSGATANEKNQIPLLQELTAWQVARVTMHFNHVIRIRTADGSADPETDLLSVYQSDGPNEGLYVSGKSELVATMRQYSKDMDDRKSQLARKIMFEDAPRRALTSERDLVPVKNGVFDYGTKELRGFSPDLVFISKSEVEFDAAAENPLIDDPAGFTWDVETWIAELSDDDGVPELLWEIIGATLRPFVRWKKAAFAYSEKGNNGKGTFAVLLRSVLGPGRWVNLPLDEMGKDFMLEPLIRANAIITDENNVGIYVDKAANAKAIVTNDVLHINRKGLTAVSHQFWGFMFQCLNEFPRFKDKSQSLYRRQLFIPFRKWFGGAENPRIKEDYLQRPEVLRYVLKRVLLDMPSYYALSNPTACQEVLAEFMVENDPVRAFWEEFEDQFVWDLLPGEFLYDLFVSWYRRTHPSGTVIGKRSFLKSIEPVIEGSTSWVRPTSEKTRPGKRMALPEMLIADYDLVNWKPASYSGTDRIRSSTMDTFPENYRWCLARIMGANGTQAITDDDEDNVTEIGAS